jgi:hypothetical protein
MVAVAVKTVEVAEMIETAAVTIMTAALTVKAVATLKTAAMVVTALIEVAVALTAKLAAVTERAAVVYQRGHWFVSNVSDVRIMWNITAARGSQPIASGRWREGVCKGNLTVLRR